MPYHKEFRDQVINFLIQNPIENTHKDKYNKAAKHFGVDKEYIRSIWRSLLKDGKTTTQKFFREQENLQSQGKDVETLTSKRVKTLEDLIEICEIDTTMWDIVSWECTKWEVGRKDKKVEWHVKDGQVYNGDINDNGEIFVEPLFRVKAKLSRRKLDKDLNLQKDVLVKELFKYSPNLDILDTFTDFRNGLQENELETKKNCLLELCLFDPHFGKLAHAEESGNDEDIKITSAKYREAIRSLISRINVDSVEKILLPIGNDMINVDGTNNMTTAGTPQSSDSRFYKIVKTVKELLIETINDLVSIAPVDVVVVPGNHDTQTMFMLGEMLDAYYHNTDVVSVFNSPKFRKYYQYGNTGILLTHGNEESHQALGMIFAAEQPELWADVKFRYCQIGHFHKNKKLNYLSVDEHQGFQVQIIPSLSYNDAWHAKKGYNSLRQAKAFLIDINDGIVGEFTHTCTL